MSLTLDDINAVLEGKRNPIWIGRLPQQVALGLGLRVPNVYMDKAYAEKILSKDEIDKFKILMLPFAISNGLLMQERDKPNILLANFNDPDSYRRYTAALKIANNNHEIWLSTFHRAHKKQTRAQKKRSRILKNHD